MTSTNVATAAPAVNFLRSLVLSDEVAALLNKSYGKGTTPIRDEKPATSKLARAKREKGEKSAKASSEIKWIYLSPIAAKRPAPSAEQFLVAYREAGYMLVQRTNTETGEINSLRVFDEKLHRTEAMWCVAIYSGWTDEPWGTQIDRAVNHARFEILPKGKGYLPHRSPEAHSARWTADGWTKGAPDAFAKIQADLDARERLAVGEVADLSSLFDMSGKTEEKAAFGRRLDRLAKEDPGLAALVKQRPDLLGTMLAIAEQRLETVREDMRTFDFSDAGAVESRYATLSMRGLPTLAEGLSLMNQFAKN